MQMGGYTEMSKTHWKKLTNPNYLGSWSFQPGEEKTVTIKEVKQEIITNQNGKEECTIAYFHEDVKPLILNKTNGEMIAKVWGTPYIEDWSGKKITLKVKKISAFGEMMDAVRVSNKRPTEESFICEACGKAITSASGRSAKEIAAATKTKYHKTLCVDCARKEENNG